MNYTAIIGVYDGIDFVGRVIESLEQQTVPPTEIIIWVNKHPSLVFPREQFEGRVANIIESSKNGGCFSRYSACYTATTEYILMLDDDTTPGKRWAEKCIAHIEQNPNDIIGSRGVILQGPAYLPQALADPVTDTAKVVTSVDVVGHCTFFKRTHVKYMFEHLPIEWRNGEDIQFCAEAMRNGVNVVVLPQSNSDPDGLGSTDRTRGARKGRVSTGDPGWHMRVRNECCAREVKERGWKPNYMRRSA